MARKRFGADSTGFMDCLREGPIGGDHSWTDEQRSQWREFCAETEAKRQSRKDQMMEAIARGSTNPHR